MRTFIARILSVQQCTATPFSAVNRDCAPTPGTLRGERTTTKG